MEPPHPTLSAQGADSFEAKEEALGLSEWHPAAPQDLPPSVMCPAPSLFLNPEVLAPGLPHPRSSKSLSLSAFCPRAVDQVSPCNGGGAGRPRAPWGQASVGGGGSSW